MPPSNSRIITVRLIDSLGSITCSVPNRYDTFFSVDKLRTIGKGAKEEYRFQPKSLIVSEKSGFIYTGEPKDSIERFTILHSYPFSMTYPTLFSFLHLEMKKLSLLADPLTYKIQSDTIEEIGDRYFSIFIIDLFDTKSPIFKRLSALYSYSWNEITFKYELLSKREIQSVLNFIGEFKQLIRTIRLSNRI